MIWTRPYYLEQIEALQREYNMRHHKWIIRLADMEKRKAEVRLKTLYAAAYRKWNDYWETSCGMRLFNDGQMLSDGEAVYRGYVTPSPNHSYLEAEFGSNGVVGWTYRDPGSDLPTLVRAYLGLLSDLETTHVAILNDSWQINLRSRAT